MIDNLHGVSRGDGITGPNMLMSHQVHIALFARPLKSWGAPREHALH